MRHGEPMMQFVYGGSECASSMWWELAYTCREKKNIVVFSPSTSKTPTIIQILKKKRFKQKSLVYHFLSAGA